MIGIGLTEKHHSPVAKMFCSDLMVAGSNIILVIFFSLYPKISQIEPNHDKTQPSFTARGLMNYVLLAGEALDARKRGCLNITLAQK